MTKIIVLDGPLYQWDTGRKVQVVPDAGATIHEVHVAHSGEDGAFVLQPDENGCAAIPNKSLQSPGMVVIYAVTVTADGRQTETSRSFFIAARSKPDDYIYTEEELQTYQALEQRIETLEKGGASDEVIAEAVDKYLAENPVTGGATPEQAEQIEANAQAIKELQEGGVQGPEGPQGPQGETGPQGPAGPQGEQGPAGEDGADGFSPTVDLARTTNGVKITVTNKDGTQEATVYDGKDGTGGSGTGGADGKDGVTFTPTVSAEGVISWTNDGDLTNPTPVNIKGPQGEKGDTGDRGPEGPAGPAGPAGSDGKDGQNGEDGADGFSPTVAVSTITGGHRVTVTDTKGSKTFDVMDGAKGDKGDTGETGPEGPAGPAGSDGGVGPEGPQGPAGDDGADGFSPTVSVTTITGGHKVTITDASGSKSFDVMDGEKGEQGEQGPEGPAASTTKKTYSVTPATAFISTGSITAESVNGVLKVGGYFQTKKQHNNDGTTDTICTVSGVKVDGLTYAAIVDHGGTGNAHNVLLLTENNVTRVQMEAGAKTLASGSWINFTIIGLVGG